MFCTSGPRKRRSFRCIETKEREYSEGDAERYLTFPPPSTTLTLGDKVDWQRRWRDRAKGDISDM